MPKFVFLWTDLFLWLIVLATAVYVAHVRNTPNLRGNWRRVFMSAPAMSSAIVLAVFLFFGLSDSIHFRARLDAAAYATKTTSLLDVGLERLLASRETSYSAPLAFEAIQKEATTINGVVVRHAPRLTYGGAQLEHPERDWGTDVLARLASGAVLGVLAGVLLFLFCAAARAGRQQQPLGHVWRLMRKEQDGFPWTSVYRTLLIVGGLCGAIASLASAYHVFGTDQTGNDVLYQVLKSIRTAIVMGSLTTAAILPFALLLGILSGYLRGWVDDLIQYFYTTISSIPSVLLIAACVLLIQGFIDNNPELFQTGLERGDIKLLFLCLIVGVTEFATMCRLIRGETLKLAQLDYVQAAQAFGAGPVQIMRRHIAPNVMHIVIISLVLEFSGIVLYEAVLSYVGVGVDPTTNSFGTMINLARSEMARDPVVWWNLATAFVFMLTLVLAINLFADAVRDAFDPRARTFRPRLRLKAGAPS
jgi:peptide/nickel transport system permease protein